jgi:chromosome segregation ATPase
MGFRTRDMRGFGMRISAGLVILACAGLCACASSGRSGNGPATEQLRAENSLIKKRLILAERENAVLKDENLQCKSDNRQLAARIEKLTADIAALDERYRKDIALRENQYQALQQKNAVLSKESSEKIRELSELNRAIESRLGGEIARINEEMRRLQESFTKERETVRNENTRRELALAREIESLKKLAEGREAEAASLKTALSALEQRFEERSKEAEAKERELKNRDLEIRQLREKIDALHKEAASKPAGQ